MITYNKDGNAIFTKEMKKDYTILVPTMLPMHFQMIVNILRFNGYNAELLKNTSHAVIDEGLKYVHNDTCYPALLVIGQFLDAINSGKYDPHKLALIITQTGGGCRASNYIYLLRKALKKAGYQYIPVLSFNVVGLDKQPGFSVTVPMLHRMLYALTYGDLLMTLRNQTLPYEVSKGATQTKINKWMDILSKGLEHAKILSYKAILKNYSLIIKDFKTIEIDKREPKVKVGIVGEIFVKFSPLGNNNLEDFLVQENCEVRMSGLIDFCCYTMYNGTADYRFYKTSLKKALIANIAYFFLVAKQRDMILAIKKDGYFTPPTPFNHTTTLTKGIISNSTKMGEGWLLPAEMVELIDQGVPNIICAQPFGCLPNHIVGKGMMKPIKEHFPQANIIAVDYDPGASKVNQENRIKLMIANAKENLNKKS